MKTRFAKVICCLGGIALCWSSPCSLRAQESAHAGEWTLESVGTATATPDVYYLLMKMEFESGLAADAATQGEKRLHEFLSAVEALKIPNLSYRVSNNLFTPSAIVETGGYVYTRNIVFTLMSPHRGEPFPDRDAIVAKLEDLGAHYNSHCVTCIGSG